MLIILDRREVISAAAAFLAGTEFIAHCLLNWQLPKLKGCPNKYQNYDNVFISYQPKMSELESADFV